MEKKNDLVLYEKECKDGKKRWFFCASDEKGNKIYGLVPGYYEVNRKKK